LSSSPKLSVFNAFLGLLAIIFGIVLSTRNQESDATVRVQNNPDFVGIPPSGGTSFDASERPFRRSVIGTEVEFPARITHVQVTDMDEDGVSEIVVCDARRAQLLAYTPLKDGQWSERILAENLNVPAHATLIDLDRDGDLDFLISILGSTI